MAAFLDDFYYLFIFTVAFEFSNLEKRDGNAPPPPPSTPRPTARAKNSPLSSPKGVVVGLFDASASLLLSNVGENVWTPGGGGGRDGRPAPLRSALSGCCADRRRHEQMKTPQGRLLTCGQLDCVSVLACGSGRARGACATKLEMRAECRLDVASNHQDVSIMQQEKRGHAHTR